jgi:hypothetical protein
LTVSASSIAAIGSSEFRVDIGQGSNLAMYSIRVRGRSNEAAVNEMSRSIKVTIAAGVYDARLFIPDGWSFDSKHYASFSCLEIDSGYAYITSVFDQFALPTKAADGTSVATSAITTHSPADFPSIQCWTAMTATASGYVLTAHALCVGFIHFVPHVFWFQHSTSIAAHSVVIGSVSHLFRTGHTVGARPLSWQTIVNMTNGAAATLSVDLILVSPLLTSQSGATDYLDMTCIEMHKRAGRGTLVSATTKAGSFAPLYSSRSVQPWLDSENIEFGHYRSPIICTYHLTGQPATVPLDSTVLFKTQVNTWWPRVLDGTSTLYASNGTANSMPVRASRTGRSTFSGQIVFDGARLLTDDPVNAILELSLPVSMATASPTDDFVGFVCLEISRSAGNGWTMLSNAGVNGDVVEPSPWAPTEDARYTPGNRFSHALSVDRRNGQIHLYGGERENPSGAARSDHWRFNPVSNQWTQLHPHLTTFNTPNRPVNSIGIEYDLATTGIDVYPGQRTEAMMVSAANCAWIFGGRIANGVPFNDLYRFNFDTERWAVRLPPLSCH